MLESAFGTLGRPKRLKHFSTNKKWGPQRAFVPGMALFVFTQANSSYSLGPRSKYTGRSSLVSFGCVYSFLGQSMNGCCVNGFIARTTYMEPRVGAFLRKGYSS